MAGGDGTVDVTGVRTVSENVPGRGDGSEGEAPGRTAWVTIDERPAPACSGNDVSGPDQLCALALLTCDVDQVRYFVWHRRTEHVLGPPRTDTVGEWIQEAGTFCLGPDDPGVPTIGRVIARVLTEFRSLPLPNAPVRVSPSPRTLVNLPTRMAAGSADPVVFTPVLFGLRVTITARPVAWDWTFGDGAALHSTSPRVEHVYAARGTVEANVTVTWRGEFTISDAPEIFPVREPVLTTSPPVPVQVVEARTRLVGG